MTVTYWHSECSCRHCAIMAQVVPSNSWTAYREVVGKAVAYHQSGELPDMAGWFGWLDSESAELDHAHGASDYVRFHHGG